MPLTFTCLELYSNANAKCKYIYTGLLYVNNNNLLLGNMSQNGGGVTPCAILKSCEKYSETICQHIKKIRIFGMNLVRVHKKKNVF